MNRLVSTSLSVGVHRPIYRGGPVGCDVPGRAHAHVPARHGADAAAAFAAMCKAFRPSGGMARGEDLAHTMAAHRQGDYASLARQIVDRDVLSFEWEASYWLPMFQFDLHDLSVRRDLLPLIWELQNDCDGWALATWFARAHADLGGQAPVELLDTELAAVLVAARAGRQVETG